MAMISNTPAFVLASIVLYDHIIWVSQLYMRWMCQGGGFFANSSISFLKSLQAQKTLKKLHIVLEYMYKQQFSINIDEAPAKTHCLLSETQDFGVIPKLGIKSVMVQFPHKRINSWEVYHNP